MSTFSAEYDYQGKRLSVPIEATDWADAERKLWMLKAHGEIAGRVVVEMPVAGWMARAWAWLTGRPVHESA